MGYSFMTLSYYSSCIILSCALFKFTNLPTSLVSVDGTCEFSVWSEWTECSRTCGGGKRARIRQCCDEEVDFLECTGNVREIRSCQTLPCPG